MKIYVIGFMGAGKTTIGRELARRLEIPFFDLDEMVEAAAGMSIKEIFAEKGEPYFRKRERDLLSSTQYLEHAVVATGGGTFTFEDNIQFIKGEGLSVYLSAPFTVLRNRISDKAAERPLFRDDLATLELYQYRLKYYRMADIAVEMRQDESAAEVAERLLLILPREFRAAPSRGGWKSR
jgi:shikimate kinase